MVTVATLAVSCGDGGPDGQRATTAPLTVVGDGVSLTVRPGPHSTLTAELTVEADRAVRPQVTATATTSGHRVGVPAPMVGATEVNLPLVGLRPETTYRLELADAGGPALVPPVDFTTGALPDDLPALTTVVSGRPRPGVTLFNASPSDLSRDHPGVLLAVDHEGEVVWYHQDVQMISDVRQLPSGNLLYNTGNIGAREIDVLGNVVNDWTTTTRVREGRLDSFGRPAFRGDAVVVDTPRLHHEVAVPLPNGNFLALSQEVRTFRGFEDPGCPPEPFADPTTRPQRGDVVVEFTPQGRVVHQVSLLDAIDPRRQPGSQQCNLKVDRIAHGGQVFVDWSHANSATLFEADNVVLVSARNLSSVMALRWRADGAGPAGEVLWQLGPDLDFELTEGEWFYRQHAPEVQADGSILVYDNGSQRPMPATADKADGPPLPYSRAVQYELDRSGPASTWTVRQVWEHRVQTPGGPVFAEFLGDADMIGGDHVLITHGATVDPVTAHHTALIVEVDRATDEIVLSVQVEPEPSLGWRTYRAEHLDTWYPDPDDGHWHRDPPLLPRS